MRMLYGSLCSILGLSTHCTVCNILTHFTVIWVNMPEFHWIVASLKAEFMPYLEYKHNYFLTQNTNIIIFPRLHVYS